MSCCPHALEFIPLPLLESRSLPFYYPERKHHSIYALLQARQTGPAGLGEFGNLPA